MAENPQRLRVTELDFDNIKDNFTVMKEEPFGPIVPILTFKDFDEVMERANNNDLGLCSYVYTTDLKKLIEHLSN